MPAMDPAARYIYDITDYGRSRRELTRTPPFHHDITHRIALCNHSIIYSPYTANRG